MFVVAKYDEYNSCELIYVDEVNTELVSDNLEY